MLKIMKSVKIIKAIEYAFNVDLKLMRRLSPRRVRIPSEVTWFPVCVKEHPSMVSSTKPDDGNKVVTTTIKLLTTDDLLRFHHRHLVFRVTLLDDRRFLVGSHVRPFTVIEVTDTCPESVKDNQLVEVTITHRSLHVPPYIVRNVYG